MISLIDSSADLFGFTDSSGVPIYMNKAGQEVYGIVPGSKYFTDYVSEKDKKFIHDIVIPRLRLNKGWEGEVLSTNPSNGSEIPVWLRVFSVKTGPEEKDMFYAFNGSDLRNLKTIQEALITQTKMAALGEMVAEMAHEINNPLMIVQIKTQMLLQRLIDDPKSFDVDKLISDLQLIEKNSLRIQKIVNSSKAISRNAKVDPYTQISILTIVDEAVEIYAERFENKKMQLRLTIDPQISREDQIEARGSEILQVLVNLIGNAYDAVGGQPDAWMELKLTKAVSQYEIQVINSGEKIPKEIAEKMMNPFFSTKPQGHGTGLGLSLSRQIIENHKGHFFYDSAFEYTRFILLLQKKIS
ncbi:MAG: HAMP domain-containing sensor histidine kinase [Pseudobdellovibrio sp.]